MGRRFKGDDPWVLSKQFVIPFCSSALHAAIHSPSVFANSFILAELKDRFYLSGLSSLDDIDKVSDIESEITDSKEFLTKRRELQAELNKYIDWRCSVLEGNQNKGEE